MKLVINWACDGCGKEAKTAMLVVEAARGVIPVPSMWFRVDLGRGAMVWCSPGCTAAVIDSYRGQMLREAEALAILFAEHAQQAAGAVER